MSCLQSEIGSMFAIREFCNSKLICVLQFGIGFMFVIRDFYNSKLSIVCVCVCVCVCVSSFGVFLSFSLFFFQFML